MRLPFSSTPAPSRPGAPIIAKPPHAGPLPGRVSLCFSPGRRGSLYLVEQVSRLVNSDVTTRTIAETAVYLVMVTLLTASAAAYLVTRIGYFERLQGHRRVPRAPSTTSSKTPCPR